MTYVVDTEYGQLRRVKSGGKHRILLRCPGCGQLGGLDNDQANGRISVDHASDGCPGNYHETHNFMAAVERAGGWRVE